MKRLQDLPRIVEEYSPSNGGGGDTFGLHYEFWSDGDQDAVAHIVAAQLGIPEAEARKSIKPFQDFRRRARTRHQQAGSPSGRKTGATDDVQIANFIKRLKRGELSGDAYQEWLQEHGGEAAREVLGREPTEDEVNKAKDFQEIARYLLRVASGRATGSFDGYLRSQEMGDIGDDLTAAVAEVAARVAAAHVPRSKRLKKNQDPSVLAGHYSAGLLYREKDSAYVRAFGQAASTLAEKARRFVDDLLDVEPVDDMLALALADGDPDVDADIVADVAEDHDGDFVSRFADHLASGVREIRSAFQGLRRALVKSPRTLTDVEPLLGEIEESLNALDASNKSTDWSSFTFNDHEDAEDFATILSDVARFFAEVMPLIELFDGKTTTTVEDGLPSDKADAQVARIRASVLRKAGETARPFVPRSKIEPSQSKPDRLDTAALKTAFEKGNQKALDRELPEAFDQRAFASEFISAVLPVVGLGDSLEPVPLASLPVQDLAAILAASDGKVKLRTAPVNILGDKFRNADFEVGGQWGEPFREDYHRSHDDEKHRLRIQGHAQSHDDKYGVVLDLDRPLDRAGIAETKKMLDALRRTFGTEDESLDVQMGSGNGHTKKSVLQTLQGK